MTIQQAIKYINTYSNEARASLRVVEKYLRKDKVMLEVAAGLCLFSAFLKKEGYLITALEPAAGGFESFNGSKELILNLYVDEKLQVIELEVECLDIEIGEKYDLIFSNNLIEHIPRYDESLKSMINSLDESGQMVHACPNYFIPYEPHLQIPVFKSCKYISQFIYKSKINNNIPLWNSINFISYNDVIRISKKYNVKVNFKKGLMYEAFARLDVDSVYADRQSNSVVKIVWKIMKFARIKNLLKLIPARLSTPMIFEIEK